MMPAGNSSEINPVFFPQDLEHCLEIIRRSFLTVANDLHLTPQNCPANPAFMTKEKLKNLPADFRELYFICENDLPVGFVAIEKSQSEPGVFYIEKLSVLPEYRHQGYGRKLMEYAEERIEKLEGKKISLGIVDENLLLKQWYLNLGYHQSVQKKFNHLPFTVRFMIKELGV